MTTRREMSPPPAEVSTEVYEGEGEDEVMSKVDGQAFPGIELDRLSFIETALCAIPGDTLRKFFVPILSVKRNLINRKHLTERHMLSDPSRMDKMYKDAVRILAKTLTDAALEFFDTSVSLDEKELGAILKGKLTPQCYEPGAVLVYPAEFPEVMFVHVVLSGCSQVVNYQVQSRRIGLTEGSRRQYFVSNDVLRLSGAFGLQPELIKLIANPIEAPSDGTSDGASTSNVSTAIQRTLRHASRLMGQPTLQAARTDVNRAPCVLCAQEALGLEPSRLATVTAEVPSLATRGGISSESQVVETMRIRAKDLHDALVEYAISHARRQRHSVSPTTIPRQMSQLMDCISIARVKAISRHYPLNEILMRQSWLLQDTPAHTIRVLVTQLTPRSFFPGDVILCPHSSNRELSFLRRGTMTIEEVPVADSATSSCQCGAPSERGQVLQEVHQGASFGELSALFGEPRQFVLRAKTPCDIWSLSRLGFTATIRRDDALRASLLSKAAALRMRWLGEQRYTDALAQKLRECCELFRGVPDSFIRLVQERVEPVVYPPGTLLTSTSARCNELFIITHGRVASIVDGVAEYGPGSTIGEATIISHRWPLGLVSKTMVEGWKLTRSHLRDALERIELLRHHSGEAGCHVQQLMQHVFAPPIPPCEVDAVGRCKMPTVGPPPQGKTYLRYAEWLAELQLRALCFKYRDLVDLNDISYATIAKGNRLEEGHSSKFSRIRGSVLQGERSGSHTALDSAMDVSGVRKGKKKKQRRNKRKVVAGSIFPFHVNSAIAKQPFVNPAMRKEPSLILGETDSFLAKQRAMTSCFDAKFSNKPLPQLQQLTTLLESRDKLMRVEAKQQRLGEAKQERLNVIDVAGVTGPAPVHIFLLGRNPRVEITVEEAISVGYVLQFPDTKRIQSCVSNIDSDVTLGLPQHRQRRRDMAFVPNDRHHRYCFLFAASQLGEKTAEEVLIREAAVQEVESKEKAQHLITLLVPQLPGKDRQPGDQQPVLVEMEGGNQNGDWRGVAMPVTPFLGNMSMSVPSTPQGNHRLAPKEAAEQLVLQQLQKCPERAISRIRLKFQVAQAMPDDGNLTETNIDQIAGDSATKMGGAGSVSRADLLDRLRCTPSLPDIPTGETTSPSMPPRRVSFSADEKGGSKTSHDFDRPLEAILMKDDTPVFVDGYGQLNALPNNAANELAHVHNVIDVGHRGGEKGHHLMQQSTSETNAISFPNAQQQFVMPTVNEAIATMRRIQSDVQGLNAVAEEQRRERLQRRHRRDSNDLLMSSGLLAESQRIVEDWATEYRSRTRDSLYSAQIPPLLLHEAGTDYLAAELRSTRRQQVLAARETQGVEIWRDEVDARGGKEGKTRDETRGAGAGGKTVLVTIGARKLGLPSVPLLNPTSNMSPEEYQRWVKERDAAFAAASLARQT